MTPPDRGPRLSTLLVVVCSLLVVVLAPLGVAAAQTEEPVSASLELADRPAWVTPGQPLALDVRVTTTGTEPDAPVTARVEVHRALRDTDELTESSAEDVGVILTRAELGPVDALPLPAPDTRRFELTTMPTQPGVYPVVVEVLAPGGEVLATVRTPVIQLGDDDDPLPAPSLSLLVDVAVPTTITPGGRRPLTAGELDRLDRLAGLVESDLDLTFVAVPDTLDALTASTDARAVRLAAALLEARSGRTALPHPYVELVPAALEAADLAAALPEITDRGTAVLADRLGAALDTTVWDGDDLGAATAALLLERGVRHFLRPVTVGTDDDEPDDDGLLVDAGPTTVADVDASVVGVDVATSERLQAPAPGRTDDAHTVLADLLLRDDGRSSDVVIRVDDAPEGSRLGAVLPLLTMPGSPVDVGALAIGPTDPDDGSTALDLELPRATLPARAFERAVAAVATFASLVGTESARAAELDLEAVAGLAGDLDDDARDALLDHVTATVDEAFDNVHLAGQTDLNLTSRSGSLPVTVVNENPFPVQVTLRLRSDRLRFPDGEELTTEVGLDATRLDIPVEALATGSVPTFVTLWTPDGGTQLDTRQLNVRSTAISGVGLALSAGALLVLLVWWLRTWRRGRRSRDTPDAA